MAIIFGDFDVTNFWKPSSYANGEYVDDVPTDAVVVAVEKALGYQLPKSYIELMRHQNGGIPVKRNHRTKEPTTWANDHIAITRINSIGHKNRYSLCGGFGSRFWIDEWGYPPIGIYFANCPSGGHDMVCLDYRESGPTGEPQVVHVDQEWDYKITFLAKNFESFIRGLEGGDAFDLET